MFSVLKNVVTLLPRHKYANIPAALVTVSPFKLGAAISRELRKESQEVMTAPPLRTGVGRESDKGA